MKKSEYIIEVLDLFIFVFCIITCSIILFRGFSFSAFNVSFEAYHLKNPLRFLAIFLLARLAIDHRITKDIFLKRLTKYKKVLLALSILIYFLMLLKNTSFVCGGADSYGYVTQAILLKNLHLSKDVPILKETGLENKYIKCFIPLGYCPSANGTESVPTYPQGTSLLMAFFMILFGMNGAFIASPIIAIVCLVVIFYLAREFGLSEGMSILASFLIAITPTYLFVSIQPFSDVIATMWICLAILFCLKGENNKNFLSLSGLFLGFAILTRPNLVLLIVPFLFFLKYNFKKYFLFFLGVFPGFFALLVFNYFLYGTPFSSGYEGLSLCFRLEYFTARVIHYIYYILGMYTPFIFIFWTMMFFHKDITKEKKIFLILCLPILLLFFSFYYCYKPWTYIRFLLPSLPVFVIGSLLGVQEFIRRTNFKKILPGLIFLPIFFLIIYLNIGITAHRHIFRVKEIENWYPQISKYVKSEIDGKSVVFTRLYSGCLNYYDDIITARWDMVSPLEFDFLIDRLESKGYKCFLLLSDSCQVDFWKGKFNIKLSSIGALHHATLYKIRSK